MKQEKAINIRHVLTQHLQQHDEILFAYLHGSFVEGLPYHDVDVAVYVQPSFLDSTDAFEYEMTLSAHLSLALRKDVDVHLLNQAPLGFCHTVLKGELLFAKDMTLLTDYIERIGWDYMHFAYYKRQYLQEVFSDD